MEPLNKSSSAEQRIFSPIRSVPKPGNTSSIPPLLELSAMEKSLAVSSCRFNQIFLRNDTAHGFRILSANKILFAFERAITVLKTICDKIVNGVAIWNFSTYNREKRNKEYLYEIRFYLHSGP